jgi:type II secretory pathway component PulF
MAARRELVYHNLAVLLEAGLPVKKALETVGSGLRGRLARDLRALSDSISRGSTIAEAMATHPRSFSRMEVMIVQAGETSGMVAQAVQGLAEWYEFCTKLRREFWAGMAYPLLLIHAAAFLLPAPDLFMGGWRYGPYLRSVASILGVVWGVAAAVWAVRRFTPQMGLLRRIVDGTFLKIPIVGRALVHLALGRFARVFHTLYAAGVPIQRALEQSISVSGNAGVARWLGGAMTSVRSGNAASEGFSRKVPREFVAAWSNGEISGQLDVVSAHLADMEGDAAHFQLSELARWIPRIIYLGIVLWVAATIVLTVRGLLVPMTRFEF